MGEIYDKWSVCDLKVRCWEQETTQVLPFGGEWMVESSCGVDFSIGDYLANQPEKNQHSNYNITPHEDSTIHSPPKGSTWVVLHTKTPPSTHPQKGVPG